MSKSRQIAEKRGRMADKLVALRLRLNGWKPLKLRYRCPYGEIDLIMQKPGKLLFVEVKYTSQASDDELEKVLPQARQQRRIYDTAQHFLSTYPELSQVEMQLFIALVRPYGRIKFIDGHFFDMI